MDGLHEVTQVSQCHFNRKYANNALRWAHLQGPLPPLVCAFLGNPPQRAEKLTLGTTGIDPQMVHK
jgi:hypothetical protein